MSAILQVEELNKSFGGLHVTRNVSLALAKGDRVALIGPNGAGKTTLVNLVTGHLKPSSGHVLLGGADISALNPMKRVRAGLVRSFQVTRLFPEMTPEEHVALAILQREGKGGRMAGTYRSMPRVMTDTYAILDMLNLVPLAQTPVVEIAYGQQRLLEIAIATALRPKVLLLDEPAAGVPHGDTFLIENALAQLPDELAVLMIDHDMDLVFRFAKRVIVLAAGEIIFDGSPRDVTQNARVRQAYLGSYVHASGTT